MKKFYLFILCLAFTVYAHAQNFYWVGGATGNWNTASNWSGSSNGSGGAGVPNGASHQVFIDNNAQINLDLGSVLLSRLIVTGDSRVLLVAGASDVDIELTSTNSASPALQIDANSVLIDSTTADIGFNVRFADGAKAAINGTWRFTNADFPDNGLGSVFEIPSSGGLGNAIQINGRIEFGANASSPLIDFTGNEYVFVNAGAVWKMESDGGFIPDLNWDPLSLIEITGVINDGFSVAETESLGSIYYDCPNQSAETILLDLYNITIEGNLEIVNTNGSTLILFGNRNVTPGTVNVIIEGDLTVSGNSVVAISDMDDASQLVNLQVNGNFNAGGTAFDMQLSSEAVINTTVLGVAGNFNHSAGSFGSSATATVGATDLYVVELNGTTNQTVFSHNGSIDNANNDLTLRINNAAGVTLNSPLQVGMLSFASAAKGVITSSAANLLTINNTSNSPLVVNSADNTGYVNGPVSRKTAAAEAHLLPTGKNGAYRPIQVSPEDDQNSQFVGEYFATVHEDPAALPPLRAITNEEYWSLNRVSGSDAVVTLSLVGKVPNAVGSDTLVVAGYNGSDRVTVQGSTGTSITNGDAESGELSSETLSAFGLFTIGLINDVSLPIDLLSFNGSKGSGNTANLNWEISSNSTPERFEIMRSVNGRDFVYLGSVSAGKSQLRYSYTDQDLPVGTSYYRLRLVDIDGTVTFSKVIAVMNGQTGILLTAMVPTIVTNAARLDVTAAKKGSLQLIITDMYGRIIQRHSASIFPGSQPVNLDLQRLAAGAYQVTGLFEGVRTGSLRFIKQ